MGVPLDLDRLAESGMLSDDGLARVRAAASLPPTSYDGDVSVGDLVDDRSGPRSPTGWSSRCSVVSTPARPGCCRRARPCRSW